MNFTHNCIPILVPNRLPSRPLDSQRVRNQSMTAQSKHRGSEPFRRTEYFSVPNAQTALSVTRIGVRDAKSQ
jgi:hypothetical protein